VSNNHLGPGLPAGLRCCGTLRELSAAKNHLEDVGDLFVVGERHGWRVSLVSLDLSANQLGPALKVCGTEALDTLSIVSNRVVHLELAGAFPRLSALLAGNNKIARLPTALLPAGAPALCTMDLLNNDLSALPPELGLSIALKRITLVGNPLRSIRPELLRGSVEDLKKFLRSRIEGQASEEAKGAAESAQDNLAVELRTAGASHKLSLEGQGLTALPPLPAGLRVLHVSRNALTASTLRAALGLGDAVKSPELGADLTLLSAGRNALNEGTCTRGIVLRLVESLPALQDLDLSFNRLTTTGPAEAWMPWQGATPPALTRVDFSGNFLAAIPGAMVSACPMLHELRVRQNHINSMEAAAAAAGSSLNTLDLEENRLSAVPAWLPSALPQLRTLLLANNSIGPALPPELGFWSSLQSVNLAGNPLRSIRQALMSKGWPAVAAWLRDRLPEGAEHVAAVPRPEFGAGPQLTRRQEPAANGGQGPGRRPPVPAVGTRGGSWGGVEGSAAASPAASRPPSAARRSPSAGTGGRDQAAALGSRAATPSLADSAAPSAAGTPSSAGALEARIERLRGEVAALEEDLQNPGMSRSKQSAVNHSLRMKRAELLKADREFRRVTAVAVQLDSS